MNKKNKIIGSDYDEVLNQFVDIVIGPIIINENYGIKLREKEKLKRTLVFLLENWDNRDKQESRPTKEEMCAMKDRVIKKWKDPNYLINTTNPDELLSGRIAFRRSLKKNG